MPSPFKLTPTLWKTMDLPLKLLPPTEIHFTLLSITSNNQKTGVNVVALVNRFETLRVKCWTANFCDLASEGSFIFMHQSKSISNGTFKDSHSHPIHTCFPMIATNVVFIFEHKYFYAYIWNPLILFLSCFRQYEFFRYNVEIVRKIFSIKVNKGQCMRRKFVLFVHTVYSKESKYFKGSCLFILSLNYLVE